MMWEKSYGSFDLAVHESHGVRGHYYWELKAGRTILRRSEDIWETVEEAQHEGLLAVARQLLEVSTSMLEDL